MGKDYRTWWGKKNCMVRVQMNFMILLDWPLTEKGGKIEVPRQKLGDDWEPFIEQVWAIKVGLA